MKNSKQLSPFSESVTLKSRRDRERPSGEEVGFSISYFRLGCRLFMVRWNSSAFSSLVVWRLYGLMRPCEERAILSSLSMNSMAKMPDVLQPVGRPSVWRNMRSSKVKYMLWSVT